MVQRHQRGGSKHGRPYRRPRSRGAETGAVCPGTRHIVGGRTDSLATGYGVSTCQACGLPACLDCLTEVPLRGGMALLCRQCRHCGFCPKRGKRVTQCAGCGITICKGHRWAHRNQTVVVSGWCRNCAPPGVPPPAAKDREHRVPVRLDERCAFCGQTGAACLLSFLDAPGRRECCHDCRHTKGVRDWDELIVGIAAHAQDGS